MTTTMDTNVLVALWNTVGQLNTAAQKALDSAQEQGALLICGAAYAELLALRGHAENMLDEFFDATSIRVDWESSEHVGTRQAGRSKVTCNGASGRKGNCPAGFSPISLSARINPCTADA